LYQSLAIVLEKKEDYKNAYFFYTNYTALKDSIFSKESTEKILEVETKYQTQKKENEIVKLKQEKQLQYIELESRKIQRNFLIAVLILVFFILLLLFKLYYSKLNTNKILERKNKQIEKQTELLEKSNILLEKLNATKDKFFSIIAHDVKNPLMAIKSASMAMQSGNIDYTKNMVLINGIARSAETLSEYLDNLLKWALCQTEKIDVNITDVNIFKVVNEIVQIYSASIDNKKLNINISIPINFCVKSDENLLSFIFRNVINNAIKFTQENGSINISTSIQNNQYCFSVSDTGIGIKRKDLENLFSIEQNKHTINNGSSGEKGTGLGLILCKEFVDLLGGKIEVKSVQGVGSTFSFSFPFIKQDDEK
jgi:signal transduction histidine kinase